MDILTTLPIWQLALLIFLLRVVDVGMGTIRTLAIVEGIPKLPIILGFFEILIWVIAVSQVVTRIGESWILAIAYAGGFACGNAVGIFLEKRFAFGGAVLRIISSENGHDIARNLRSHGQILTTFDGEGRDSPVTMIYLSCQRRKLKSLILSARAIDPDLFYVVERANDWGRGRQVTSHPTGWRSISKKK